MFNDSYTPRGDETGVEEQILDLLRAEEGRLAPSDIYADIGVEPGTGQHPLYRLTAAGWVRRPRRGLYEFAFDPREMSNDELAVLFLNHALELSTDAVAHELTGSPEFGDDTQSE